MTTILAIDPGIHGAIARYNGEAKHLWVRDMPTYKRAAGKRNVMRDFIDEDALVAMIQAESFDCDWLFIEQVGGIPQQSAAGAFVFGRGVGVILGAARGMKMAIEEVAPVRWKNALKVPADKDLARERASELLPEWSGLWPLVKHDGRAESAMLAYYGWKLKGRL